MRIALCNEGNNGKTDYESLMLKAAAKEGISVDLLRCDTTDKLLFHMQEHEMPIDIILLYLPLSENDNSSSIKIRDEQYHYKGEIVFIAPTKEYTEEAFDVSAFHYIVEGLTPVSKVLEIFTGVLEIAREKKKEYFLFNGISEYRNVEIASIMYFEVIKRIITVHYNQDDTFEFYSPIGKLEGKVVSYGFVRVHRSFLVAVNQIDSFDATHIIMKNGDDIPCGRKYYQNLKAAISSEGDT